MEDSVATQAMTYEFSINQECRAERLKQKPVCFWLTGLSGAGKSTIADALEQALWNGGRHTYVLDADAVRNGLNADLGFTREARNENVRRLGHVARTMVEAGLIVIVTSISPYTEDRQRVRAMFKSGEFVEVFVSTGLDTCIARDTKGLYGRARKGTLTRLSGWDDPYEIPGRPEVEVDAARLTVDEAVAAILNWHALSCA